MNSQKVISGRLKERVRGDGWVCRGTNGKGTVCDCLSARGVDFSVPLLGQEPTFLVSKAPDEGVSDTEVLLEAESKVWRMPLSLICCVSYAYQGAGLLGPMIRGH